MARILGSLQVIWQRHPGIYTHTLPLPRSQSARMEAGSPGRSLHSGAQSSLWGLWILPPAALPERFLNQEPEVG